MKKVEEYSDFNLEKYNELIEELNALADCKYREFHSKLIPGINSKLLGVRVPILRKVARRLAKGDFRGFIECAKSRYNEDNIYEINMLMGMVIGLAVMDFDERLSLLDIFVPIIDNWAVCDIAIGDLKSVKDNKSKIYEYIQKYLNSDREYEVRFAVVVLMQYFIEDDYIDKVLQIYDNVEHEGYYVKMAVAWAISVFFITDPCETKKYLNNSKLDKFVHKKALQKIKESKKAPKNDMHPKS